MSEVCKGTKIEPKLTPLSGQKLQGRTSNNSKEARVDIGLEVTGKMSLQWRNPSNWLWYIYTSSISNQQ